MTQLDRGPQGTTSTSGGGGGFFWWELDSRQKARRTLVTTAIFIVGYIAYCIVSKRSISPLVLGLGLGINLAIAGLYWMRAREEEARTPDTSVLRAPVKRKDTRAGFYALTGACIATSTLLIVPQADLGTASTAAVFIYSGTVQGAALAFGLFALPSFYFVGKSLLGRESSSSSKGAAALAVVMLAFSSYAIIAAYNASVMLLDANRAMADRGPPILLEADDYEKVHSQTALSQMTIRWDRKDGTENLIAVRTPFIAADANAELCDRGLESFLNGILKNSGAKRIADSVDEPSDNERCRRRGLVRFQDGLENEVTAGIIPCPEKGGAIVYTSFVPPGEEVRDPARYLRCQEETE